MVGVNVFAADTDEEAQHLFTSLQQAFLNLIQGHPGPLPPPIERMDGRWNPPNGPVDRMTRVSVIGAPATVQQGLNSIIEATDADELILTGQIYDHQALLRRSRSPPRSATEVNPPHPRPAGGLAKPSDIHRFRLGADSTRGSLSR